MYQKLVPKNKEWGKIGKIVKNRKKWDATIKKIKQRIMDEKLYRIEN